MFYHITRRLEKQSFFAWARRVITHKAAEEITHKAAEEITHKAAEETGCLARFDLNLPSNRFELFWVTKLFSYLVQSLFAYLHCFSAVCATKLPSLS